MPPTRAPGLCHHWRGGCFVTFTYNLGGKWQLRASWRPSSHRYGRPCPTVMPCHDSCEERRGLWATHGSFLPPPGTRTTLPIVKSWVIDRATMDAWRIKLLLPKIQQHERKRCWGLGSEVWGPTAAPWPVVTLVKHFHVSGPMFLSHQMRRNKWHKCIWRVQPSVLGSTKKWQHREESTLAQVARESPTGLVRGSPGSGWGGVCSGWASGLSERKSCKRLRAHPLLRRVSQSWKGKMGQTQRGSALQQIHQLVICLNEHVIYPACAPYTDWINPEFTGESRLSLLSKSSQGIVSQGKHPVVWEDRAKGISQKSLGRGPYGASHRRWCLCWVS